MWSSLGIPKEASINFNRISDTPKMPSFEAPSVELGSAPQTPSFTASPSPSEISSASSPEPPNIRATPLFRALAMPPPEPDQPPGQEELERRLPGYRRIVIPRELTLIELLKQSSGVCTDEEVLRIREAKLRVIADRVGLRRLHILAPRLRKLILDGSAIGSLRDLGIGLNHLKVLSINRCNLSSLDGVWGLGTLRELYAAGNRIQDLQPLAALQKLHTLDLAKNPIAESSRIWTLGVCSALRRLTLDGTPVSETVDYRSTVALALPMLMYLDERPLHMDIDYESDEIFGPASSSDSELEQETEILPNVSEEQPTEAKPGPSHSQQVSREPGQDGDNGTQELALSQRKLLLRRPATTENAGIRPARPNVRPRPRTAVDKPVIDKPTRLQLLSTLMDDEWLSSGSKLTSMDPMCGNLARALRRPNSAHHLQNKDVGRELTEQTMAQASRIVAAEIPRAPKLEDWIKFTAETGIEIDINLNDRPECSDSSKYLDRLEQIEKETQARFKEDYSGASTSSGGGPSNALSLPSSSTPVRSDYEIWNQSLSLESDLNTFFTDVGELHSVHRERFRFPGNNGRGTE